MLCREEKVFQRFLGGNTFMERKFLYGAEWSWALPVYFDGSFNARAHSAACWIRGWSKCPLCLARRLSGKKLTGSLCFSWQTARCGRVCCDFYPWEERLLLHLHKPADLLRIEKAERAFFALRICLRVLADLPRLSECSVVCRLYSRFLDIKLCWGCEKQPETPLFSTIAHIVDFLALYWQEFEVT